MWEVMEMTHSSFRKGIRLTFVVLFLSGVLLRVAFSQNRIRHETLGDGVERWSHVATDNKPPRFFQELGKLLEVVFPNKEKLPFGRSVAFLVGVSQYDDISPQLGFVENDIQKMRAFLFSEGGFDEVYVAMNESATPELVKNYMANKFRNELGKRDRLFFYYSGHGADLGGQTGYMQFSKAKTSDFANHVLRIDECLEWSRIIPAKHILFIYDCCVSGLAFTSKKSGLSDVEGEVLRTLSGDGSRTVITAGTAEEEALGVGDQSVFTKAFLDAFKSHEQKPYGFLTTNQIFAQIEVYVREVAHQHKRRLTPRRWELQENQYRGTFVFLNSQAKPQNIELSNDILVKMGAEPSSGKPALDKGTDTTGFIQIPNNLPEGTSVLVDRTRYTKVDGKLFKEVDGKPRETVDPNEPIPLPDNKDEIEIGISRNGQPFDLSYDSTKDTYYIAYAVIQVHKDSTIKIWKGGGNTKVQTSPDDEFFPSQNYEYIFFLLKEKNEYRRITVERKGEILSDNHYRLSPDSPLILGDSKELKGESGGINP
jgi:hypothetical protein